MDSTAVESNNNDYNKLDKVDDSYEDDFEKDIDSEESSKQVSSPRKPSSSDDDHDVISPPPIKISPPAENEVEKGQQELESPGKERSLEEPSDNDSELDNDAYNFTEDQKRAMMELLVQKQEDVDLLDEEPPEYNVKGRLEQLNAELANDPTPVEGDRETRVLFKPEIVDLVAPPPPDYSDDESQPNSARGQIQASDVGTTPSATSGKTASTNGSSSSGKNNNDSDDKKDVLSDPNKKQFVVERDGNFAVLSANELTPSEREMYIKEEKSPKKAEKQRDNQKTKDKSHENGNNNNMSDHVAPKPPTRPRPNTAATGPRRNVRPAQSPRPKSATQSSNSSSLLDGFSYNSPYAMTTEEKELARKQHEKSEEERIKREREKQEEEEERKKYNDQVFQAWLKQKKEEDRKKQEPKSGQQKSEQERREENEQAYKTWLKEKRSQGKKEKLLKRRQQQEQIEGYFLRPREECEQAFKEWLKKKNADIKKQQAMERQRSRMYRVQVRRSKKTQALVKALKESQAFRYVDYYGYRF